MDYDNDTKVGPEDIKKFCLEHYLDLAQDIIIAMFRDGSKNRPDLNRDTECKY